MVLLTVGWLNPHVPAADAAIPQKSGGAFGIPELMPPVRRRTFKVKEGGGSMTKRENYEQRTEKFLLPLMEEHGFELVDVEFVKEAGVWYLRAYIDKEGGIAVDDCEVISRKVSDWLDKEDFIDESYILEVSSPGLGRPLKKEKDFARSIGKDVEVRLYKALNKSKEYTGALEAYDKESVTLKMEDGSQMTFQRADIALIRLALDF